MRRLTILAILVCFSGLALHAQTPKENLEKAVEMYNADREFQNGLSQKTLTDEQVNTVKSRMDQGIALLEKVIREGNADQIKVARYFKTNFLYSYFFVLGMKGRNPEAYELNKQFEADMTRYAATDFPMSYDFFDKKYNIQWTNFSSTQAEYYTGFSEVCYNMSKYPDAVRIGRLALAHPGVSDFQKYVSINKILDANVKSPGLLPESERLDAALQSIQLYDIQDESSKKIIQDNNYPTAKRGSLALVQAMLSDNSPAMQTRCATAAPIAAKYENTQEYALQLYQYCYKNKYAGSDDFHKMAVGFAEKTFASGTPATRQTAQEIGDAALMALISKVSATECEKLREYASDYKALGLASKGLTLEQRFNTCVQAREEAARRAEAARKRQEKRANRHFNVYLGVDVVPLLTSVEKMDFGGHIDFRGRKVAHSFGYAVVNKRKDWNSNRSIWDGNRYFYALKIFSKHSGNPSYSGFYVGYSDKTFAQLPTVTATSADGSDIRTLDITPVDKQYELMWNSGVQVLGRPFGVDFWFGIGASYNQLSFKEINPADGYTFSGNDFFDNRKKLESINLKMRMGLSVGLNFGKKR